MTNTDQLKLIFFNLLKFSFSLGASEVKSDMDFFRKKESRIELREEFSASVRPIFLKYLLEVDKKTVESSLSLEDRKRMAAGFVPNNWSVHHQKPLSWGGRSFNCEMLDKIENTKLTAEQESECLNASNTKQLRFRYQLDNFLAKAQKKGRLEETFIKLFKNHLIFLPHKLHTKLEENYLMPQVLQIAELKEGQENTEERTVVAPMHYLIWDQFIYKGKHFTLAKETKIKRIKEDCPQKLCFRRRTAYLRQGKQRTA